MDHPTLFDYAHDQADYQDRQHAGRLHRVNDPRGSVEAAERQVKSGKRASDKRRVLAAVRLYPGSTSATLASICSMDRHMVARRLPDLERDGLVVRDASGPQLTWRAK